MTARILVVDDNPDIAGMLADLLALAGHDTQVAPNGARALERLAERDFDLIISDLMMPELDGAGLWRELRRRHPGYAARVIFMTGAQDPSALAFLHGADVPVLRKPFTMVEVNREVRHALDAAVPSVSGGAGPE
jgi:two-component system NtrC family sensor kinase